MIIVFFCDIKFRYAVVYVFLNTLLFLVSPIDIFAILLIPLLVACTIFWIACLADWID